MKKRDNRGLDGRQTTALRKQANEQFALTDAKIRAFIDCFNQTVRHTGSPSEQFASSGDGTPNDRAQTQSRPSPDLGNDGAKGIKRVPEKRSTPRGRSQPSALEKAVDDCFATSVPNYRGLDWARYNSEAPRPKRGGQIQQPFDISGVAADQALDLDEAVYGAWTDRELMRDYLIGWVIHCLTDRKVLPK